MRLDFCGLKAADAAIELDRLNLLTGPVGSGKSSVLEALRFVALGYIPAIGKTESATARLMRGPTMRAQLFLSGGRRLERGIAATTSNRGAASYRSLAFDSSHDERAKTTEHAERIRALFGASDAEAAENLDLRSLLSLSGNERSKKIQHMLDASGMRHDEIMAMMIDLAVARMANYPEGSIPSDPGARLALANGLAAAIDPPLLAVFRAAASDVSQWMRETTLAEASERAKAAKSESARSVTEQRAARAEIENRAMTLTASAKDEAEAVAARTAAVEKRGALIAFIRSQNEAASNATGLSAAVEASIVYVAEAQERLTAAMQNLDDVPRLEAELAAIIDPDPIPPIELLKVEPNGYAARLEAEAAGIISPPPPGAAPIIEASKAAFDRVEALSAEASRESNAADAISELRFDDVSTDLERAAHDAAVLRHERTLKSPWRSVEKIAMRDTIDADSAAELMVLASQNSDNTDDTERDVDLTGVALYVAETDKADAKRRADEVNAQWKAHNARAAALVAERQSIIDAERARVFEENSKNDAAYRAASTAWMSAIKANADRRQSLLDQASRIRADHAAAVERDNLERQRAHNERSLARDIARTDNANKRKSCADSIARTKARAIEAQNSLDRATNARDIAQAKLDGTKCDVPAKLKAEEDLIVVVAEIRALDARIESAQRATALREEMARLLATIEAATHRQVAFAAIEWALTRARAEDVQRRSGSLTAIMDQFLSAAGRDERAYIRVDRGVCEFGWTRGGAPIAVEALSGGEGVIFSAALAAAVIISRNPPLKVLLLEGAELGSGEPAQAIMRGAAALPFDLVCVATNAQVEPVDGYRVIHFAAPQAITSA